MYYSTLGMPVLRYRTPFQMECQNVCTPSGEHVYKERMNFAFCLFVLACGEYFDLCEYCNWIISSAIDRILFVHPQQFFPLKFKCNKISQNDSWWVFVCTHSDSELVFFAQCCARQYYSHYKRAKICEKNTKYSFVNVTNNQYCLFWLWIITI